MAIQSHFEYERIQLELRTGHGTKSCSLRSTELDDLQALVLITGYEGREGPENSLRDVSGTDASHGSHVHSRVTLCCNPKDGANRLD